MIKDELRKKRKRKRRLTALAITAAVLAVLAIVVVKVFTVEHVEVEGNVLYEDDMISKTVLNDEYSWNSLYVFLKYKFMDTKTIPFVDTMEISLKSPHTLSISVYEKGMIGYIYVPSLDQNAYFDKDGFVVETSTEVIEGIPMIEGISCDEVVLYEELPIDKGELRSMLTLTQALKRTKWVPDTISFKDKTSSIFTYGKIQVCLGSTELLTKKIERLEKILPSLSGKQGTLHLENWTEETTNIVFEQTKIKKQNKKQ